jgi:tRNASer (uridine44-2'-O)-methyltransferase
MYGRYAPSPLTLSATLQMWPTHQPQDAGSPDDPLLPNCISDWGSQDIAIAAFLMLLWKDMYPPQACSGKSETEVHEADGEREWDTWGRPRNGFLDLGCVCSLCLM